MILASLTLFSILSRIFLELNKRRIRKIKFIQKAIVWTLTISVIFYFGGFIWPVDWTKACEVKPKSVFVFRDSSMDFPTCKIRFSIGNLNHFPISIEILRIWLFREDIEFNFSDAELVIGPVPGNSKQRDSIIFRKESLARALKVPQSPSTAKMEIVYKEIGTGRVDSIKLQNEDVIKCTYWQTPIFESIDEGLATGVWPDTIGVEVFKTRRKTGKQSVDTVVALVFIDSYGRKDIDFKELERSFLERKKLSLGYYLPALRRRFGGIYFGSLASDTSSIRHGKSPSSVLAEKGDYEMKSILEMSIEEDFTNVLQFIHYTFDNTFEPNSFALLQENADFLLVMTYDDSSLVNSYVRKLFTRGYRVITKGTGFSDAIMNIANRTITVTEKEHFADLINSNKTRINQILHSDGFLLFVPSHLDTKIISRISNDIENITRKKEYLSIAFNSEAIRLNFVEAPFLSPVIVVFNFADSLRTGSFDSVRVLHY